MSICFDRKRFFALAIGWKKYLLSSPFVIAGESIEAAPVVSVALHCEGKTGRGEGAPQDFLGQSVESEVRRLEALVSRFKEGCSLADIQSLLPASSARNALDCAFWDLEAKLQGKSVWELAGVKDPSAALASDCTIGLASPADMAREARTLSGFDLLKIKLDDSLVEERLRAIRMARPDVRLIVDVNCAWTLDELKSYFPLLKELEVELCEQPLARGQDEGLLHIERPVPVAADESCYDRADLDFLAGRYDFINIKLDKCGGLTEGLALAREAKTRGMGLMVGCMNASSLSMASTFVLAPLCQYRDLDGASMLAEDLAPSMPFSHGMAGPIPADLWGYP